MNVGLTLTHAEAATLLAFLNHAMVKDPELSDSLGRAYIELRREVAGKAEA